MMQSIFSSKLYKASSRQDKIKSALDNPINAELVQQLSTYLDDEYQKPEYIAPDQLKPSEPTDVPSESNDAPIPSNPRATGGSAPSGHASGRPLGGSPSIDTDDFDDMPAIDTPIDNNDTTEDSEQSSMEESSIIHGKPILASTDVVEISIDPIVGLLNATEPTAGVSYGKISGDELWLYYNDKINLNNVMENAIRLLNSAGYANLEFNRLARSDNAMVFEITQTPIPMEIAESEK